MAAAALLVLVLVLPPAPAAPAADDAPALSEFSLADGLNRPLGSAQYLSLAAVQPGGAAGGDAPSFRPYVGLGLLVTLPFEVEEIDFDTGFGGQAFFGVEVGDGDVRGRGELLYMYRNTSSDIPGFFADDENLDLTMHSFLLNGQALFNAEGRVARSSAPASASPTPNSSSTTSPTTRRPWK